MTALVRLERFEALLRKEKDGASPPISFRRDSLNAFIPRFAGVWRLFYFQKSPGSALVFPIKPVRVIFFTRATLKDQCMKKISPWLALAGFLFVPKLSAVSLDEIQFWAGSGTNRAALVVAWTTPEAYGFSTVPAPSTNQTLVWGYRFNGTKTGTQMLQAIVAADPRFYVAADFSFGIYVVGLDYDFPGDGSGGLADGNGTNFFTRGWLTNATVAVDAAAPLNPGNLYWGGYFGPNWEVWTEVGGAGGFLAGPDRGTNPFWTADDTNNPYAGVHGEWELAQYGLDELTLTNGSWIGFSVAAGAYDPDLNAPYNLHKHAPSVPEPGLTFTAPPIQNLSGNLSGGQWQAHFQCRSNWTYALERSEDFLHWSEVTSAVAGTTNLLLPDPNPPGAQGSYRVRAERP